MDDKNKDFAPEETAAVEREGTMTEERDGEEASLIIKFRKPYVFEGKKYTEVDLTAMEDTTAEDTAHKTHIERKAKPLNTDDVTLRLWSIEDFDIL